MDAQTKLIFDKADAALMKATGSTEGALTLTQTTPETSDIAAAVMKGRECAARLADVVAVLGYYAARETYSIVPANTPIAEDCGERARAALGRLAD